MVHFTGGLLLFSAFRLSLAAPADKTRGQAQAQQVLLPESKKEAPPQRKLQGRFLHITGTASDPPRSGRSPFANVSPDLHPDALYKVSSDSGEACHSGHGPAGLYGAEVTDCDSPFSLVNATFDWIDKSLKDEIDFVVWTGDSARHDNDERHPRTEKEVVGLNTYIVDKFVEVFGKTDNIDDPDPTNDFILPIVPTFGNNDMLPHNIFEPGPNKWTKKYAGVWDKFIPQEQLHSFARGGWFFTEVIPNKLAVISLNTMYFFDSNSAVDGCEAKSEPGYEHMEWLRVQLQFLRDRGMKAILMGHVPPARTDSKQNWDETCWQKYTLWTRQYRDVVVGSIYGHMNIDHFLVQDFRDIKYKVGNARGDKGELELLSRHGGQRGDPAFSTAAKDVYLNDLREAWQALPKPPSGLSYTNLRDEEDDLHDSKKKKSKKQKKIDKFMQAIGGKWAQNFALTLVSPSVVPNYYPTLRVIEYNITGLEDAHLAISPSAELVSSAETEPEWIDELDFHDLKKKKKKDKRPKFKIPKPPSKSAPPGPAYSPQTFTFTSYTQYFANLTRINNIDGPQSAKFEYEVEYASNNDTQYKLPDLTMRTLLDLAQQMAKEGMKSKETDTPGNGVPEFEESERLDLAEGKKFKNHVWRAFVKRAFVGTKPEKELDDHFG
jgi:endopolyphosphatase